MLMLVFSGVKAMKRFNLVNWARLKFNYIKIAIHATINSNIKFEIQVIKIVVKKVSFIN